jgi:hypothetical protein
VLAAGCVLGGILGALGAGVANDLAPAAPDFGAFWERATNLCIGGAVGAVIGSIVTLGVVAVIAVQMVAETQNQNTPQPQSESPP